MAGDGTLIALVAAIIGVGVVAQILSDRYQVPSIIFLLAAGIALVARDGEAVVPSADYTMQTGDRVTVIGNREAVRAAMSEFHPS